MQQAPVLRQPVPMQQQSLPIAQVQPAPVTQEALATAAAATTEKPKRSPRTNGQAEVPASAALGAEIIGAINAILASSKETDKKVDDMTFKVMGLLQQASTSKNSALEAAVVRLGADVEALKQLQTWTLMAFLTFMQENMNAPMKDILGAAISDAESFKKLVAQATGKE
jgi:hypothetical protein